MIYPGEIYLHSNISAAVRKYSQIKIGNEVYGSQNSRSKRSSYILAKWCGRNGAVDDSASLRPASIDYFIKHTVQVDGCMVPHIFAVVNWFEFLLNYGVMTFMNLLVPHHFYLYREFIQSL